MHALVGQEAPFDHGREQMQLLAGLEVTTKSVERIAEAIGGDIAQREQGEIQKALQLDLPAIAGEPIPILYVQMTGRREHLVIGKIELFREWQLRYRARVERQVSYLSGFWPG